MRLTENKLKSIIRVVIKEAIENSSLYKPDDQFRKDMAGDGALGINFDDPDADHYLDDLVARNQGYKSYVDMTKQKRAAAQDKMHKHREAARKEVGIDDEGFLPDRYGAFVVAKDEAEAALARGDEAGFMRAYRVMDEKGSMMHTKIEDYWKQEPGVQKLIDAYTDMQDDSIFNISRSPTLKTLGMFK